ncbi:hypothetical protein ACA910_018879 [Epithemia clementina (nom. ined.)]
MTLSATKRSSVRAIRSYLKYLFLSTIATALVAQIQQNSVIIGRTDIPSRVTTAAMEETAQESALFESLHPTIHDARELSNQRRLAANNAWNTWCPHATCHVTDLCHPCRRRYLVILATGRSGSTTLQEMLHSLPGVRMSGENNGMLANLQRALQATRTHEAWSRAKADKPGAWRHNPVPPQSFACVVQQMINTLSPPLFNAQGRALDRHEDETIVGFKSIRFPPVFNHNHSSSSSITSSANLNATNQTQWLREAAEFLNETLPCAKFLVSIRDPSSHAESVRKAFRRQQDFDEQQSRQRNREMLEFAQLLGGPSRVHVMESSQWTKNISLINHMVSSFMGFDTACHFQHLFELNTNHIYGRGNVTSRSKLPPGCRRLSYS